MSNRDYRPAIIEDSFAKIPLGVNAKDGYMLVDRQYSWIEKYKWHKSGNGYAGSCILDSNGNQTFITAHRLIIEAKQGMVVDHINRDKLDNRLENLRICTQSDNLKNRIMPMDKTSIYKGVCWSPKDSRWRANIVVNRKQIGLGYFSDELKAASAYNKAAIKYFGDFSRINII